MSLTLSMTLSLRTSMFVGSRLPQLLYEKDRSSVIEEIFTDNLRLCNMKCRERL
ncbi:hypothetical protein DPMN_084511 [Dreissena polymorpha]|uniref:Uncharacterized protein n=1 Tax=Dreissena polymorpha TaxID=45954 RepID=A0A9D4BC28_DREPO|nr:hypothetical protein DPMN_084511 [Dreissena polymorpha]